MRQQANPRVRYLAEVEDEDEEKLGLLRFRSLSASEKLLKLPVERLE